MDFTRSLPILNLPSQHKIAKESEKECFYFGVQCVSLSVCVHLLFGALFVGQFVLYFHLGGVSWPLDTWTHTHAHTPLDTMTTPPSSSFLVKEGIRAKSCMYTFECACVCVSFSGYLCSLIFSVLTTSVISCPYLSQPHIHTHTHRKVTCLSTLIPPSLHKNSKDKKKEKGSACFCCISLCVCAYLYLALSSKLECPFFHFLRGLPPSQAHTHIETLHDERYTQGEKESEVALAFVVSVCVCVYRILIFGSLPLCPYFLCLWLPPPTCTHTHTEPHPVLPITLPTLIPPSSHR